jgi:mevalonate kinase
MAWGLEKMRPQVVAMMDGGADQALRDEFLAEFDAQVATAKELGSAATAGPRMQAIGELMQMLQELMSDQSITADEMERFVAASKQAREAT